MLPEQLEMWFSDLALSIYRSHINLTLVFSVLTFSNGEKKGLTWSQAALPVQAADQSHRLIQSAWIPQSHIFILNFLWYLQYGTSAADPHHFYADPY